MPLNKPNYGDLNWHTPLNAALDYLDGQTTTVATSNALKAPLASPTFTGTVTLPATTSIGNVSAVELAYVDGVTSSIQTQLNAKQSVTVVAVPATPTSTGVVGQIAFNSNHVYIAIGTNSWARINRDNWT